MQQTRLPLAAAPARAGTARAGRPTRFLGRPPLAQQERHRRHQPRGKHRARNDIPQHKHPLSAPCGNLTTAIAAFRTTRKPRRDDCTIPHRAEHCPERFLRFRAMRNAARTIFTLPRHAETSPRRCSPFRTMRKLRRSDVRLSAKRGSLPKSISSFLILRNDAQDDFGIPYFEESRPEQSQHSLF